MSSILSEAAPAAGMAAPRQTAGAWLRDARQQRGLHIVALAAMLKVPQAKLEALEADRWQDLPDTTFVRALAKAICRVLKVDAAPVLALLPHSEDRELTMSRGLNQPFRDRVSSDGGFSLALLQRPVVWAPVLLLLAAAAVYFMPAAWLPAGGGASSALPEPVDATPTLTSPALPGTAQSPASANSLPVGSPASAALVAAPLLGSNPLPTLAAPAVAATTENSPAATRLPSAPSASAAVVAQAPLPGSVPLQVKVSSESWVEVVDASGRTLLSKLLRPGDVQALSGPPPLRVRVGNVSGTELLLRGEPVDLLGRSKDNVARLELN